MTCATPPMERELVESPACKNASSVAPAAISGTPERGSAGGGSGSCHSRSNSSLSASCAAGTVTAAAVESGAAGSSVAEACLRAVGDVGTRGMGAGTAMSAAAAAARENSAAAVSDSAPSLWYIRMWRARMSGREKPVSHAAQRSAAAPGSSVEYRGQVR